MSTLLAPRPSSIEGSSRLVKDKSPRLAFAACSCFSYRISYTMSHLLSGIWMYFTIDKPLDKKQTQSLDSGWKHQVSPSLTKCSGQGTRQVASCLMSTWSYVPGCTLTQKALQEGGYNILLGCANKWFSTTQAEALLNPRPLASSVQNVKCYASLANVGGPIVVE